MKHNQRRIRRMKRLVERYIREWSACDFSDPDDSRAIYANEKYAQKLIGQLVERLYADILPERLRDDLADHLVCECEDFGILGSVRGLVRSICMDRCYVCEQYRAWNQILRGALVCDKCRAAGRRM